MSGSRQGNVIDISTARSYRAREICATCVRCGRHAYNDEYFSTLPDGSTYYWMSLCEHDGGKGYVEVTCECGMVCPFCFTADELASYPGAS
jgi:hypothetical protein